MTTLYSEDHPIENKELPTLQEVIISSLPEVQLSEQQLTMLSKNISNLILETVPELSYVEMSDSFLFESGFEACTKQSFINLKKIGIEEK